MSQVHVQKLTALIARADPKLPSGSTLEVKHFFGGAAAWIDGSIFVSLTKVGLALKLPEEDRRQLFRSKDAGPLRYFPKAPVKKQYALFSDKFLNSRRSLKTWIEKSISYAQGE